MSFVCCFFLDLHSILSFASVVFDFNASLNDVTPMSSISLSFDLIKRVDCL